MVQTTDTHNQRTRMHHNAEEHDQMKRVHVPQWRWRPRCCQITCLHRMPWQTSIDHNIAHELSSTTNDIITIDVIDAGPQRITTTVANNTNDHRCRRGTLSEEIIADEFCSVLSSLRLPWAICPQTKYNRYFLYVVGWGCGLQDGGILSNVLT